MMKKKKNYVCPAMEAVVVAEESDLLVGTTKEGTVQKKYQYDDVGTTTGNTNNEQEGSDADGNQFIGF